MMAQKQPKILIGILDWGLGHATRTSEIIDTLLRERDYSITIATSGRAYWFVKRRYPNLQIYKIPAVKYSYSRSDKLFELSMVLNFIKLLINFVLERLWIARHLKKINPQLIISDNRYGIFSRRIYSVVISHLLYVLHPKRSELAERLMHWGNCFFLRNFDENWIPDYPGQPNLSGILSHKSMCLSNVFYIGLLSRFKGKTCTPDNSFDIVCSVSGVEPQRSILVRKLIEIFNQTQWKVLIISGVPEASFQYKKQNIQIVSHLDDPEFCKYFSGAKYLIVRGGYSTIMDLIALRRTALLIPTPKQTEQEYICQHLADQKLFFYVNQAKLSLPKIQQFMRYNDLLQKNLELFYAQKVQKAK